MYHIRFTIELLFESCRYRVKYIDKTQRDVKGNVKTATKTHTTSKADTVAVPEQV